MTSLTIILVCLLLCTLGTCGWLWYRLDQTKTKLNKIRQRVNKPSKTKKKSTLKVISESKVVPFEQVLNLLSGGILISGRDGEIVWCNREVADILDVTLPELMGKPISYALSQLPVRLAYAEAEVKATEFDLNGRKIQGTMHVLYGIDGLDEGAVAVLNDVTAWHQTIQIQQKKLDTINRELKERLNTMGSSTKFLENSINEPHKAWLPQLHESVGRVTELIETLVQTTLMRSDETSGTRIPINLGTLVYEVLEELKEEVKQRQIYVKTEIESQMRPILCQPEHIKTILRELLINSLRFNRPGGMVQLVAKLQQESNEDFLVLNVSDDGQGISIEDQKKIFDVFYRPEANFEGSQRNIGVGLAIVHAIVEAYKGRIWFKSQPEKGTLFTILLPAGNLNSARPYKTEEDEFDWIEETQS
ncbi:MAG: ATP-binding protein [Chloroflexota bacterium]